MDDAKRIQVVFPEGATRHRRVKVLYDGKQLPVHSFEITPGGDTGYNLTLKIRTGDFEVLTEMEKDNWESPSPHNLCRI